MATPNMVEFIEKNKVSKVVFAEHRTIDNKPVLSKSDLGLIDRTYYKFEDGSKATLTNEDAKSVPEFKPDWAL
jgi:hypothetical protein